MTSLCSDWGVLFPDTFLPPGNSYDRADGTDSLRPNVIAKGGIIGSWTTVNSSSVT